MCRVSKVRRKGERLPKVRTIRLLKAKRCLLQSEAKTVYTRLA
jgi:hypothetical protein